MEEIIRLTERLQTIADLVLPGGPTADIGTDHGYIPIYLSQKKICPCVIASDVNRGPLEKMRENMTRIPGEHRKGIVLRQADGLEAFEKGEADTVIIAGMGGLLIIQILSGDMEKTRSCKRLILQPRNAPDKLRKWLLENDFFIEEERLVREGKFIWEIMAASPCEKESLEILPEEEQYYIGRGLAERKDPLLKEFLNRKIATEEKILCQAGRSSRPAARRQAEEAKKRLEWFRRILSDVDR